MVAVACSSAGHEVAHAAAVARYIGLVHIQPISVLIKLISMGRTVEKMHAHRAALSPRRNRCAFENTWGEIRRRHAPSLDLSCAAASSHVRVHDGTKICAFGWKSCAGGRSTGGGQRCQYHVRSIFQEQQRSIGYKGISTYKRISSTEI